MPAIARIEFVRRFLKRDIFAGSAFLEGPFPKFKELRRRHILILSCNQNVSLELFRSFARKVVKTKVGFVCTAGPASETMHDLVDEAWREHTIHFYPTQILMTVWVRYFKDSVRWVNWGSPANRWTDRTVVFLQLNGDDQVERFKRRVLHWKHSTFLKPSSLKEYENEITTVLPRIRI
jgi:hypothetical protein